MIDSLQKILHKLTTIDYIKIKNHDLLLLLEDTKELGHVKELIQSRKYDEAIKEINKILYSYRFPKLIKDDNIKGLQTISKLLEVELSVLLSKKADLNHKINQFRLMHNRALGELIKKILYLRYFLLNDELKENPDVESKAEDAKNDFEEYTEALKNEIDESIIQLDDKDKELLHKYYRKASKLCHPDMVSEESEKQAEDVFIELNKAYYINDLERVIEIFNLLDSKKIHLIGITENVGEKDKIIAINNKLRSDIGKLKTEIDLLIESNTYQTILSISDTEAYFNDIEIRLKNQLEELEAEYEQRKTN